MGGANCPETPRQKMIGMMYLVLTALLALNVSKDILNAFIIVNESIVTTNINFAEKNNALFTEFESQWALNKTKVGPYFDKAKKAKELSDELIKFITDTKRQVIGLTDYNDKSLKEVEIEVK
jgi:gliding motility-associated protein GldM